MSEQATDAEEEQPAEEVDGESEEQPDIDPEEQADMGELATLAEEVEEKAGANVDDEKDDTGDEEASSVAPDASEPGADWGDLYVRTVTTGLNAVIEEHGHEDAEPVDEDLARDLHLHEHVNDWMAEQGKAEMDPAQGMLLATAALCLTVLVSKTDLPSQALSKAKSDSQDDVR